MSRWTSLVMLAVTALVVVPATPAAADPPHDVPDDATITITGDGSGHGRGMSQYGAYSAARQGVSHREVLRTYYPKTRWKDLRGTLEVLVSADDDRSLIVGDRPGLKVRAGTGRLLQAHLQEPQAKRWRITRTRQGAKVAWFDTRWRTFQQFRGDVSFTAGGAPLALRTPEGVVRYRGELRSATDDHGGRVTVSVVSLEDYARGVVASEMQAGWPAQALRAQAVASRTYGGWRRTHPLDVAYDICDTTLCQVYGGASAETAATDRAVRGTARRVLTFRRTPIFAEFSASNGGHTVDGGKPYLPARPDPYEGRSPDYYGWTVTVTSAEMEAEYDYDNLTSIAIEERDGLGPRGGRVTQVRVTAESGFTDTVTGEDFRRDWGLPSTLFTITDVS